MKKVLKFRFESHEGFLSITQLGASYYALVIKDTKKVEHIKCGGMIELTTSLKGLNFKEVPVTYLDDFLLTKQVFEKLNEEKNLYFKELTEAVGLIQINPDDLI